MKFTTTAAAAGVALMIAGGVQAATFNFEATFNGTECNANQGGPDGSGLGDGFALSGNGNSLANCTYKDSPSIAKFDVPTNPPADLVDRANTLEFTNGAFSSINGDEFAVVFETAGSGTWSYTPGTGDPSIITAFVLKQGNAYSVFEWDGASTDFTNVAWDSDSLGDDLSHITFFDSEGDTTVIPLPAAGWLMLAGLGGLAALRRRKKAA